MLFFLLINHKVEPIRRIYKVKKSLKIMLREIFTQSYILYFVNKIYKYYKNSLRDDL